jgi:hypothetical protein
LARGRARGKVVAKGRARGHVVARGHARGKDVAKGRARGHVVARAPKGGHIVAEVPEGGHVAAGVPEGGHVVVRGHARGKVLAKGQATRGHVEAKSEQWLVVSVDCVIDGFLYSLTKYSAIFAEVEGYFGIHNNQLGTVEISKSKEIWSKLCSLRR